MCRCGTALRVVFVLMLLPATGCLVLPVPHTRLHAHGTEGRIVDEDGKPVPNATITSSSVWTKANPLTTVTDENGCFFLEPVRKWHGAVFWGVIGCSFSFLPKGPCACPISDQDVEVRADGFAGQNIHAMEDMGTPLFAGSFGRDKNWRATGDIVLVRYRTATNYLAAVTKGRILDKKDVSAVLLCENVAGHIGLLAPICVITDTKRIETILSEMSVPAESAAPPAPSRAGNNMACHIVFLDASSNIVSDGHILYFDETIKNSRVWRDSRWKNKDEIDQTRADTTWVFQSKIVTDLVRETLFSKRPGITSRMDVRRERQLK